MYVGNNVVWLILRWHASNTKIYASCIVRNYEEFVDEVSKNGLPNYVSFDHDLADISYSNGKSSCSYREKTGYDCAKWLVDFCYDNGFKLPSFQVHSANTVGKKNIQDYLKNAKKHLNI